MLKLTSTGEVSNTHYIRIILNINNSSLNEVENLGNISEKSVKFK